MVFSSDKGICRLALPGEDIININKWLKKNFGSYHLKYDNEQHVSIKMQLLEYLRGRVKKFDCDFDLRGTPFQLKVWNYLRDISYGSTLSYKQVAWYLGLDNGQRAVGNAIGKNPVPIIIPCHRVIRENGSIGGYAGGERMKERLLELEASYK